jgi:hypothetical protein
MRHGLKMAKQLSIYQVMNIFKGASIGQIIRDMISGEIIFENGQ